MNQPPESLEDFIEQMQNEIRRYVPGVMSRLALTYGGLLVLVLIIGTVLANFLAQFIPVSTATLIAFALNLWLLVEARQRIDNRLHSTGLFVLYTRSNRERRALQRLQRLQRQDTVNELDEQRQRYEATALDFIEAAQEAGVSAVDSDKRD